VLQKLRARGKNVPVLVITSMGQEREKLKGFNMGADDYIVKPILLTEVVARIRAILKRVEPPGGKLQDPTVLRAGDLHMDLLAREVRRGTKTLRLTKVEFDLLEQFMRRPGQVISQNILEQSLLGGEGMANTNALAVHVLNLRAKLDRSSSKTSIRTVRGCGYALDA